MTGFEGPVRTCVGCRRRAAKDELARIVRMPSGCVVWDRTGHTPGRGAYVCSRVECFEQAVKRSRIDRALRAQVGAADVERLRREFVT